jgi:hypothetical protein
VGFLDSVFGRSKVKAPAPDRLFAMSTAYVKLSMELGLQHRNSAGIVFQPLGTADFGQIVKDTEELLRGAAEDTGTTVETHDDEFGYRWVILRDPDFDDLVQAVNVVSTELTAGGYGDRLLAAVFAFGGPVYWIYNYKRGSFYPFVPKPGSEQSRDSERELRLKAQIGADLPIEDDLARWFPLWGAPI